MKLQDTDFKYFRLQLTVQKLIIYAHWGNVNVIICITWNALYDYKSLKGQGHGLTQSTR